MGDVRVKLRVVFAFSSGLSFESETSNYASVEAAREVLTQALSRPDNTITWHDPDGGVRVIRAALIAFVEISAAS